MDGEQKLFWDGNAFHLKDPTENDFEEDEKSKSRHCIEDEQEGRWRKPLNVFRKDNPNTQNIDDGEDTDVM